MSSGVVSGYRLFSYNLASLRRSVGYCFHWFVCLFVCLFVNNVKGKQLQAAAVVMNLLVPFPVTSSDPNLDFKVTVLL